MSPFILGQCTDPYVENLPFNQDELDDKWRSRHPNQFQFTPIFNGF